MRRAVERVSRRQLVADRIVIGVLVVVAASGLMSVLPGQGQAAISRLACQVGSLGLGRCGTRTLAQTAETLNPPRCRVLADLDAMLPEVRTTRFTSAQGLPVQISTSRAGDAYLSVGGPDSAPLPEPLAGQARGEREVLPGASVPSRAEWLLPGGQGVEAVVEAIHDQHRQWAQRRSAMAVLAAVTGAGGRDIPPPTLLYSRVDLSHATLPHFAVDGSTPSPRPAAQQRPSASYVLLDPTADGTLQFNRVSRESAVVADLAGVVGKVPVSGSVRWTRDASGVVTSVTLGVVSTGSLAPGDPATPGTVGTAYVVVPVRSSAEEALVASWLSNQRGFRLGLDELLGLRVPETTDQLSSFLTRAATVTVLRYSGVPRDEAVARVADELTTLRRTEWAGDASSAKLTLAGEIAAQPNRTPRRLVVDTSCGTA